MFKLKCGIKRILLISSVLVNALWSQAHAATAERPEVHLSFQERVLATYALLSYKASSEVRNSLFKRATNYITEVAKTPLKSVQVRNFNEFLSDFRGEWPNSGNLATDIKHIESQPVRGFVTYVSPSPRVQKQIDRYLDAHVGYFQGLSFSQAAEAVQVDPTKLNRSFEQVMEKHLSEFNTIGTKIAETAFNAIPNPLDRIPLRILFDQYYALQPLENKMQIISEILGQRMNLGDAEKFAIMVQNSGPQFQKLLQVIIRQNGIPDELKKSFKMLEDSARPVPWWQVEKLIQSETGNYKFSYFERKPLGVGTMAQVHRAKINFNGQRQDVVVRFLKPGIAQRVDEDHRILTQVAEKVDSDPEYRRLNGPLMSPVMEDISATVRAELDMRATMDRQARAKLSYDKDVIIKAGGFKTEVQFYVPRIFGAEKNSQLMIQELVIGRSLDKEARLYSELAPDLKKSVIEAVAKLWFNEVLFGSGFYHSDLHQGNFLVRVGEPKTQVTLLDFGMGGVIDGEIQKNMMLLGAALQIQKADLITDIYWKISLSGKNQLTRAAFAQKVEQRLQDLQRQQLRENMFEWTGWASNEGLRFPYDFINLNRGLVIINKSLEDAGSKLEFTSIAKALALQNPTKVLRALRSNSLLKWSDLIKLGWAHSPEKTPASKPQVPALAPALRCEQAFSL